MLPAQGILDPERLFVQPAEAERSEVHVPLPIVDLDEADVLPAEGLADVDPLTVPADAAVVTDPAHFIVGYSRGGRRCGYGRGEGA